MSGTMKLGVILILGVFALYLGVTILKALVGTIINLLIPLVLVVAVGYVLYSVLNRKALGGGRRYLP